MTLELVDPQDAQKIKEILEGAQRVLVIAHIGPDGDAMGSLMAMGVALQQLGKDFSLVCDDGLLQRFRYLPLSGVVSDKPDLSAVYDMIFAVDCGDIERMGNAYATLPEPKPPVVNIDHHVTNTQFGVVNVVPVRANSTTHVLFYLLPLIGVRVTGEVAICLLTGLVTDTLSFRTPGVNADTLSVASALIEAGADLFSVTSKALNLKEISTLQMWRLGLNNMQLEDGVLWTTITNDERARVGHNGTSSFGLGNMMADVAEAAMSAVILELADGRVSVGFRSRPPFDVSALATELGGGGHPQASGCTLPGPLAEAELLVISKSKETIRQQRAHLSKDGRGTESQELIGASQKS